MSDVESSSAAVAETSAIQYPRDAGPPFDFKDADIILRSTDLVDFRVHKIILSTSSSIFKDMFVCRSLTSSEVQDETKDGLVVARMAEEDSHSLDILLRYCYPRSVPIPALDTFDDMKLALNHGMKFHLSWALDDAKAALTAYAVENAERVYALAWKMEMKDLAITAAQQSMRRPMLRGRCAAEFSEIPATALYNLVDYQHRYNQAIKTVQQNRVLYANIPSLPGIKEWRFSAWLSDYTTRALLNPEQGFYPSQVLDVKFFLPVAHELVVNYSADVGSSTFFHASHRLEAVLEEKIAMVELETPF